MRWVTIVLAVGTTAMCGFVAGVPGGPTRAHAVRPQSILRVPTVVDCPPRPEVIEQPASPPRSQAQGDAGPEADQDRLHPWFDMLDAPSVARGEMVDDQGAPVPAATIAGMSHHHPSCGRHRRHQGVEGHARDGVFVFRYRWAPWHSHVNAPLGPMEPVITYTVRAEGFARATLTVEPELARALYRRDCISGLRIVLQREAVVEGLLLDPQGAPVSGVSVGVSNDPLGLESEESSRVTTDSNGHFRIAGLDARETLWLHARSKRLVLRPYPLEGLSAGAELPLPALTMLHVELVEARFEFIPYRRPLRVRLDAGCARDVLQGSLCAKLTSGAHMIEILDSEEGLAQKIRFWIEPHQREHYEMIRLDES